MMRNIPACGWLLVCMGLVAGSTVRAQETAMVEIAVSQTAVLDPAKWDRVFAAERYFDAVRSMLVRFPGAAEAIGEWIQKGYTPEKAELVLNWQRQEGALPERGRHGWGANEQYANRPAQWHVLARALHHPWNADDPELGPTFVAWIKDVAYWERGGARGDGKDRGAAVFGPLPLHTNSPEARLDVTSSLTHPVAGETLGHRLRALEECGFQVHKLEIRNMEYRSFYAYDWAVSTACMRLWVKPPRLVVTFRKTGAPPEEIPPPTDVAALAAELKAKGGFGISSMAYPADMDARVRKALALPGGTPKWMRTRIEELRALHNDPMESRLGLGVPFNFSALFAGGSAWTNAMRNLLLMPPRVWQGHTTTDFAFLPAAYPELLPPAVMDHLKLFWEAWLHPEVEVPTPEHLGGGVHRGGPTYFRGYTRCMGTMNFSHNAIAAAMLGGQLIESPWVLRDAPSGLENVLLRSHVFAHGAHQEIGDTYYQAVTVAGGGALAKYAQAPIDRVMSRILRDRLVEPLVSMYNPNLRRITHPMARGDFTYQMLLQEGPYSVLHTLSPDGVLLHLGDLKEKRQSTPSSWGSIHGLAILGNEAPPQRMAMLSPWTEPYLAETLAEMVDRKTFPWRVTATDGSPGTRPGGWHLNYLSSHYSLASRDNANHDYGAVSITAQWRRDNAPVTHMEALSTLQMSMWVNGQYTPANLSMAEFGIVHRDNVMVALKSLPRRDVIDGEPVKAWHTSVAIVSLGDVSRREVWINDAKVDALSGARPDPGDDWKKRMTTSGDVVAARDGDRIAIHDGVSYVGLIPVCTNALERDREVEISFRYPTLLAHSFIYRSDKPLDMNRLYGSNAVSAPASGFVLEMGDVTQYPTFADFRAHLLDASLDLRWDREKRHAEVRYASGGHTLEMDYDPLRYPAVRRSIDGAWPYLPQGVQRETPWSIQARTGRIEKNGAVLAFEPGRTGYLQAVPETDTYVGYNALPDPTFWILSTPGGVRLQPDGRIGVTRAVVCPKANRLWIDTARKPGQDTSDMATALLVFGLRSQPAVELNGEPIGKLETVEIEKERAFVIPLVDPVPDGLIDRSMRFREIPDLSARTQMLDWHVVGPFPRDFSVVHPPENGVDLNAVYPGLDGSTNRWKRILAQGDAALGAGPVDLEAVFSPSKRVLAYACTSVYSEQPRRLTLFTGSDQDIAVWINGRLVMQNRDVYRAFSVDQDRMIVNLNKGENRILVKLAHDYEEWRFSMRFADATGTAMPDGLRYPASANPPAL